jgi:hypothetical protein
MTNQTNEPTEKTPQEYAAALKALLEFLNTTRAQWDTLSMAEQLEALDKVGERITESFQIKFPDREQLVKLAKLDTGYTAELAKLSEEERAELARQKLDWIIESTTAMAAAIAQAAVAGKAQPIADTNGNIPIPSDRIQQAMLASLIPGAMKKKSDITSKLEGLSAQGMTRASEFNTAYLFQFRDGKSGSLDGAIGFFNDPGYALWQTIQKAGELAIRLQVALWGHAYAETGTPAPDNYITLKINDLCDSLGYKKDKGAHRQKNKMAVKETLLAITQTELIAIAKLPNGSAARLKGPLWARGVASDISDRYDTERKVWKPATFSFSPGPFFADKNWREYNSAIGYVAGKLLTLKGHNDKWAILLGFPLALWARANSYRPSCYKVRTLLSKSGLQTAYGSRVSRMREIFEESLDRVKEAGGWKGWRYDKTGMSTNEVDSLEEPEAVDLLHKESFGDWRDWNVVIDWPAALTEKTPDIALRAVKNEQKKKKRR